MRHLAFSYKVTHFKHEIMAGGKQSNGISIKSLMMVVKRTLKEGGLTYFTH